MSARGRRAALALAAALLGGGCGDGGEADPGAAGRAAAESRAAAYAADPRVAPLLAPCPTAGFYDRNVADVVPLLVEKLERGAREPLQRAKEELAAAGPDALQAVRRLLERHFAEPHGSAYLLNAIDVAALSDDPAAREVLLRATEHPAGTVRVRAVQGLARRHARPEDFERLLALVDLESPEQRQTVVLALHAADPERAEALYLGWMRTGERPESWRFVALPLARSRSPATAEAAKALADDASPELVPFLLAPAAALGDEDARARLAERLLDPAPEALEARGLALQAALEAELVELLARSLAAEPDPRLRALAVDGIARAEGELSAGARDALRAALDDLSPIVRRAALDALVARGDPVATDRALAALEGSPSELAEAVRALRPRLLEEPELARRALERLLARDALEEPLPLARRVSTLKALGQVPLEAAARRLRALGLERSDETVEGHPAHRWATIQAANTGEPGRAWLAAELAEEDDPARRLDLLWATSASRSDATRERLLAMVEGGAEAEALGLAPWELLFVADRLARLGPASAVAGPIKRMARRVEVDEVRAGLQCLLWTWF